jgi:hypothetical protein
MNYKCKYSLIYFGIIFIILILNIIYIFRINVNPGFRLNSRNIEQIYGVSPIGRKIYPVKKQNDFYFSGYLSKIFVETHSENLVNNKNFIIKKQEQLIIIKEKLSIKQKLFNYLKHSQSLILINFLFLSLLTSIFLFPKFYSSSLKELQILLRLYIHKIKKLLFIPKNIISIIVALCISSAFIAAIRLLGVKFEKLYFTGWWINIIWIIFLSIPVGIFLLKKNFSKNFLLINFGFWTIFLLMYFVVCPADYMGNYGFHGFFHEFLIRPAESGFFSSLTTPDTGYLAILPRIFYGIAYFFDNYGAYSIAFTSFVALIIYSAIFSYLCGTSFSFLIPNDKLRCTFVIIMSILGFFSLSPLNYAISITDVSYFGFILISIFLIKTNENNSKIKLIFYSIIGSLFILSKAHLIAFAPVSAIIIFYKLYKKQFTSNILILSAVFLTACIIQAVYISNSLMQMQSIQQSDLQSFTIEKKPIGLILIGSFIYFIKSYMLLSFPLFSISTGFLGYLFFFIGTVITVLILSQNLKNIRNSEQSRVFFLANILVLSCIVFMFRTFPSDASIDFSLSGFLKYAAYGNPFFSRYTIGIHNILALTVIPSIFYFIQNKKIILSKQVALNTLSGAYILLNFIIVQPELRSIEFYQNIRNENWSEEWYYLSRELKHKPYYVPIVFYPALKQEISSPNTYTIYDGTYNKIVFNLIENKKLLAVIVLNDKYFANKNSRLKLKAYYSNDSVIISPLYPVSPEYKFIFFSLRDYPYLNSFIFVNGELPVNDVKSLRIVGVDEN